jgi:hypothetical protein
MTTNYKKWVADEVEMASLKAQVRRLEIKLAAANESVNILEKRANAYRLQRDNARRYAATWKRAAKLWRYEARAIGRQYSPVNDYLKWVWQHVKRGQTPPPF